MKSERPTEVEFDARVIEVGGGEILLERAGAGEVRVPATQTLEMWAAANLYKFVKVRIQLGSCMEPLPR